MGQIKFFGSATKEDFLKELPTIAMIMIIVGVCLSLYFGFLSKQSARTESWTPINAQLIGAEVKEKNVTQYGHGTSEVKQLMYCPEIKYTYQAESKDYYGKQIRYVDRPLEICYYDKREAEDFIQQLQDSELKIYFDPEHPYNAVVYPGMGEYDNTSLKLFLSIGVLLGGIGLRVYASRTKKKKKKKIKL